MIVSIRKETSKCQRYKSYAIYINSACTSKVECVVHKLHPFTKGGDGSQAPFNILYIQLIVAIIPISELFISILQRKHDHRHYVCLRPCYICELYEIQTNHSFIESYQQQPDVMRENYSAAKCSEVFSIL